MLAEWLMIKVSDEAITLSITFTGAADGTTTSAGELVGLNAKLLLLTDAGRLLLA